MKLTCAISKLAGRTGNPLKYFYAKTGVDRNPVVLIGSPMPTDDEQPEVLKTALSKKVVLTPDQVSQLQAHAETWTRTAFVPCDFAVTRV